MSNIEDKYRIGNHTINILEGLGYEVILGDGLQGVEALIDKENQEFIPSRMAYCVDIDLCIQNPYEWDYGVNTHIFKGINDEEIRLEEYGKTTIYYDNLEICIYNNNGDTIISIEDKEEKKTLYIKYSGSIDVYNKKDEIASIYTSYDETEWGYFGNYFPVSELTIENVKNIIYNKINSYNETSYLSERLKKGIEIIAPAIDSFVEYFKKDFDSSLEYRQQVEKQKQKEWEKKISYYLQECQKSQEKCEVYRKTRALLKDPNPEVKKPSYIKHHSL